MNELKSSMRLSLIFGFIGAAMMPVIYEIYANISAAASLFFLGAWVVFVSVKFSRLPFKEAFVGITCIVAYSGIFGWLCYMFIHPMVVRMLMERSVYFQLSLSQQFKFVLYAFLEFAGMYVLWLMIFGMKKAVEKLRSNREKAGEYINNAFDDEMEDKL